VQSAGFALFYGIEKCSYSSGTPPRIALAILGVQSPEKQMPASLSLAFFVLH